MVEALITVAVTLLIVGVLVPLTIAYLLVRQIWRMPLVRRITGRPQPAPTRFRRGSSRQPPTTPTRLGRQWAQLLHDAEVARRRFAAAVATFAAGPLRDTLAAAAREVDAALVDAQRLAFQGDRTERAYRDVTAALEMQRRRARRAAAPSDLERDLQASTRAQSESAQRLAVAVRRDLCQLQLVVARLHELTAHTLELTAMTTGQQQLNASASIADRLAALRIATAEVEQMAAV